MNPHNEHDTLPPSMDPAADGDAIPAPSTLGGILRRLGPGLIIAGSIVGSGELIATTKTGAQAGIALLWLVIIGCVIKVFVQVELGRYAISHGETTLAALDRVPGPRLRANWIIWCWSAMMLCTIGQLGGIIGGVGQAMALTFPITGDYIEGIRLPGETEIKRYIKWQDDIEAGRPELSQLSTRQIERIERGHLVLQQKLDALGSEGEELVARVRAGERLSEPTSRDAKVWAGVVALITSLALFWGRYRMIQNLSTVLVVSFTILTLGNVISLQMTPRWQIPASEFLRGMSFGPPEANQGLSPWVTALATFGIIGVGASELVSYPYWCLEKGYAKFAGPRSDDESWVLRARGWMRVMHYDAFISMIIYTVATLAFFLMGVAVLYRDGLDPDGMRMVSTLSEAYVPVFGTYAKWLFLSGAIAVLYSTFLVANAANARMVTDGLKVFGLLNRESQTVHDRAVTFFSVLLPLACLLIFCLEFNPVALILTAGLMQNFMLPVLGLGAIYLRFNRTDPRLHPSRWWDVMLLTSFVGLLIAGSWGTYEALHKLLP